MAPFGNPKQEKKKLEDVHDLLELKAHFESKLSLIQ
jgi:hypothetical protein